MVGPSLIAIFTKLYLQYLHGYLHDFMVYCYSKLVTLSFMLPSLAPCFLPVRCLLVAATTYLSMAPQVWLLILPLVSSYRPERARMMSNNFESLANFGMNLYVSQPKQPLL